MNLPGLFGVSNRVCASAFQPSATAALENKKTQVFYLKCRECNLMV